MTNKCSSQLFVTIRHNTFINRKSSYSVRQHTLDIAAVSKFAYRGQLICILAKDDDQETHLCDVLRTVANICALKRFESDV